MYENYVESYHIFTVHPRLMKFAPMNIRWAGEWDRQLFYSDYTFEKYDEGRGDSLPHYPQLSEEGAKRGL